MAKKGSTKELSVRHERHVARAYAGERSPSSGGAVTDAGDVRVVAEQVLIECKGKFGTLTGKPARATLVTQFEKIADEAWAEGKTPALALRYYMPDSVLASTGGWVDLIVRLISDDIELLAIEHERCPGEGRWHSG